MDVELLPYEKIALASVSSSPKWLIENLWLQSACGILGGQPKCCKTWMGLDAAISISSATPCLGRFQVFDPGSALVYLAEDSTAQVRLRVEGICKSRGLTIDNLDLSIITAPALRLDTEADQSKLIRTIEKLRPRFLLLDPLVRLHRLDENNAREISGLLGFLRELQRGFEVSIMLTHHASKRASSRPGQSLRGSSDLHAFGDSNLYLSRSTHDITLTIEHRSAASLEPLNLRLLDTENMPHLAIRDEPQRPLTQDDDVKSRIIKALNSASIPLSRHQLRAELRINNQRLGQAITQLQASGIIILTPEGMQASTL
jgi:hypothetical protein